MKNFLKDESGQDIVEYSLVIALIAIVVIVAISGIGTQVVSILTRIVNTLNQLGAQQ